MRTAALVLGVLSLAAGHAGSQWGPRGCAPQGPVGPAFFPVFTPAREWLEPAGDPGRVYLYESGRLVGGYCTRRHLYCPWDAAAGDWAKTTGGILHAWQAPPADLPEKYRPPAGRQAKHRPAPRCCSCTGDCPCCDCDCADSGVPCAEGCPCAAAPARFAPAGEKAGVIPDGSPHPTGLAQDRLNGARCSINGVEADVGAALGAIETGVPDFAGRFQVVVIDRDEARRQRVAAELSKLPESADAVVRSYAPDHWHLKDLQAGRPGFFVDGSPTIYYLAAGGRVLHRQDDYEGGAEKAAQAMRKARADYDPKKDPDRRGSSPPGGGSLAQVPAAVWLIGLGAVFFLLLNRRAA